MNHRGKLGLAFLALMTACSSIIEGTSQEIVVNTSPSGADCGLERENIVIARISPTPGATTIKKTKYDMIIKCDLEGYHQSTYFNKSDVAGATVGNIILGGGIGWAIDSASGADNKYESPVNIPMVPLSEPKPAQFSSEDKKKPEDDAAASD